MSINNIKLYLLTTWSDVPIEDLVFPFNVYYQTYRFIIQYFVIALALCSLLVGIAYLLSLSTIKDKEKLSEYECGFEPFDSATRLPFDVHFYMVGILFLIFDVEIAVLFPWVLGLKSASWISFYTMLFFLSLLTIGFAYEWMRGALLWPQKLVNMGLVVIYIGADTNKSLINSYGPIFLENDNYKKYEDLILIFGDLNVTLNGVLAHANAIHDFGRVPITFILLYILLYTFYYNLHRTLPQGQLLPTLRRRYDPRWLIFFLVLVYENPNSCTRHELWFHDYLIVDYYTTFVHFLILLTATFIFKIIYLSFKRDGIIRFEIGFLLGASLFFMFILICSYNFMTMFISIIGFSIALYVVLLYGGSGSHAVREAGIKYYYLSTFSSGLLLYGIFLLYFIFTTTSFPVIKNEIAQLLFDRNFHMYESLLSLCLIFILIGFLFKLSAFPCHLWTPEVYAGSPDTITAYFILPVKIVSFTVLIRLLSYIFPLLLNYWQPLIVVAACGSMLWGCLGAFYEMRVKRFIAYTSINQIGFLLIGIACGTQAGYQAALLYLLIYIVTNIGFLILFLNLRKPAAHYSNGNPSITNLLDFRSLEQFQKKDSLILAALLFSMAGIPPLAGFFGKYFLLLHAFELNLYGVVVIGLITSIISCFYYIRVIKIMLFTALPVNTVYLSLYDKFDGIILCGIVWFLLSFCVFISMFLDLTNNLAFICAHPFGAYMSYTNY